MDMPKAGSHTNNKKIIIIILAAISLILFLLINESFDTTSHVKRDGVDTYDANTQNHAIESPSSNVNSVAYSTTGENYKTAVDDPLYHPKSQAEADWLNRNGYPSKRALDAAMAMPPTRDCLKPDYQVASVRIICAGQLALYSPAEQKNAIAFLEQEAGNGSIFALEELGQINSHPTSNKPIAAEAYRRAAIMRGNWTLEITGSWIAISDQDGVLASLMAQQILNDLNDYRSNRGLRPLSTDSKPGLKNALLTATGEEQK
jgi:hypothetical protein